MSMILEALSRAEQERRQEEGTILDPGRYVASSSIREDRLKRWIYIALLVNVVLVGFLVGGYLLVINNKETASQPVPAKISVTTEADTPVTNKSVPLQSIPAQKTPLIEDVQIQMDAPPEDNPVNLATEKMISLQEEAKVTSTQNKAASVKKSVSQAAKKVPPVRYSATPIESPNNITLENKIQENAEEFVPANTLSFEERSLLGQYEINVHVYDTDANNRFVLINMIKYKEGDHLPDGGPLIAAITPEGVVVDTGGKKTLIERK